MTKCGEPETWLTKLSLLRSMADTASSAPAWQSAARADTSSKCPNMVDCLTRWVAL